MDIIKELAAYQHPEYPWQQRMMDTEQNQEFHGEGNVYRHTLMVIEALLTDQEYQTLEMEEQKSLLAAAFFHDIAKPFCTRMEDGKIISPGHAVKGAMETRKLFYKYSFLEEVIGTLSFQERETVCSLVRYHGLPLFFLEKEDIKKELFKASLEVNLKHLSILARADVRGRICGDQPALLEQIDLFEETCAEFDCLGQMRQFPDNKSRILYMKKGEQYLHYQPYHEAGSVVRMMAGLPASGKDTFIRQKFAGLPVISLDDIRAELHISPSKTQGKVIQTAKQQAKILLAAGEDFVWNATNISLNNRTSLIDLFMDYDARVQVIYLEEPYQTITKRNQKRERMVPENVLSRMADNLSVPKLWEAEEVVWWCQAKKAEL